MHKFCSTNAGKIRRFGFSLPIWFIAAFLALTFTEIMAGSGPAAASDRAFNNWVKKLWPTARRRGVSRRLYVRAFRNMSPDPKVFKAASFQPEFTKKIWEYLHDAVSEKRIEAGQEMLKKHRSILARIERAYGVDRHVLMAIWGMESRYGRHQGDMNVIRSLATLGYRGRRRKFGRSQLLAALRILQRGDISLSRMKGSWAGAMGHTQFIPTTYNAYAVDFNRDGKRDIWGTISDALGSTGNYLKASKWQRGKTWGYEVKLPTRVNKRYKGKTRSLAWWNKRGVRRVGGKAFPRPRDKGTLLMPAGRRGPAFLVLGNFRSIKRYNNSTAYALAVGHLADRLKGGKRFAKSWPWHYRPLIYDQRVEVQKLLTGRGYPIGKLDGRMGTKTRRAIRSWQKRKGLKITGYPSLKVLKGLRKDS